MPCSKRPGGMLSLRDIVPRKDLDCAFESVRDPYQHVGYEFDLLACLLPAQRAARLDPMVAFRVD